MAVTTTYLSGGRIQGRSDDNLAASPVTQTPDNSDGNQGLGGSGGTIQKVGFHVSTGFGLVGQQVKYITLYAYKYGSPTGTGVMKAYVGTTEVATSTNSFDLSGFGTHPNWTTLRFEFTPFTVLDDTSFMLEGGTTSNNNEVTIRVGSPNEFSNIQHRIYDTGSGWSSNSARDPWLVYETVTDKSKTAITDVPAGTRYEETDTRKIFRREIGALDNTTGLRFFYKFDEASGDVINYGSVASADLTVSGLTRDVSTPSGLGNGMSTPNRDSNDYAQNTSRVNDYKFMHDGTAQWSVTFWAYLTDVPVTSSPTETACMGNVWTDDSGIGWTIRWAKDVSASTTSCRIQTFIAETTVTNNATMPLNDQTADGMMPDLNTWHFYCVTYDPELSSNNLTVTRDAATSGTGFHQGDEDNDTYSSSNPTRKVTYFARATSSYDLGMGGALAQVTIWEDRILTQAEKLALYVGTAGTAGGNGSPVASSWKEKGTA